MDTRARRTAALMSCSALSRAMDRGFPNVSPPEMANLAQNLCRACVFVDHLADAIVGVEEKADGVLLHRVRAAQLDLVKSLPHVELAYIGQLAALAGSKYPSKLAMALSGIVVGIAAETPPFEVCPQASASRLGKTTLLTIMHSGLRRRAPRHHG
jgi:hypothetical protein